MLRSENTDTINGLQEKIHSITQYQKQYIRKVLGNLAEVNGRNAYVICEYIIAEQNEINIKESTKEGKIKCLIALSTYLNHKSFQDISKQDIIEYLNSLKKRGNARIVVATYKRL